MRDPGILVDALVTAIRDIPDFVTAIGGSGNITAYHDLFPTLTSLAGAVAAMKPPHLLVAWIGTAPGNQSHMQAWIHRIEIYLRCGSQADGDSVYARLVNGVPAHPDGNNLRLYQAIIDSSCEPMTLPAVVRQADEEDRDFFRIACTLIEIGDN